MSSLTNYSEMPENGQGKEDVVQQACGGKRRKLAGAEAGYGSGAIVEPEQTGVEEPKSGDKTVQRADGGAEVALGGTGEGESGAGELDLNGEEIEREHPLMNYLVLKAVFQYCSLREEMATYRLVCRSWLEASRAQWTWITRPLTIVWEAKGDSGTTLEQIWAMGRNAQGSLREAIPYQQFCFRGWTVPRPSNADMGPRNAEMFFWTRIAPRLITSLTLDNCHFPGRKFTPFQADFLQTFPKLERLSISKCTKRKGHSNPRMVTESVISARGNTRHPNRQPEFVHPNLKSFLFQGSALFMDLRLELLQFFEMAAGLTTIVLREFDTEALNAFLWCLGDDQRRNLENFDLLDFSTKADKQEVNFLYGGPMRNFRRLHHDIGYDSQCPMEYETMASLQELILYRAPFYSRHQGALQPNHWPLILGKLRLTELHLWGDVIHSMDFLGHCSCLQVLVWNTSCYEDRFHGQRVFRVLEQGSIPTSRLLGRDFAAEIWESVLPNVPTLSKLEIDWTPEDRSWFKLGKWMPKLKSLKAKIMNLHQLVHIWEMWSALECLELAHGSLIRGEEVVKELVNFKKLKVFTWQQCPCNEHLWTLVDNEKHRQLEQQLGLELRRKQATPWSAPNEAEAGGNICIQAEYDKMLKTGNVQKYLKILSLSPECAKID